MDSSSLILPILLPLSTICVDRHGDIENLAQELSTPCAGFDVDQMKMLVHHGPKHKTLELNSREYSDPGA